MKSMMLQGDTMAVALIREQLTISYPEIKIISESSVVIIAMSNIAGAQSTQNICNFIYYDLRFDKAVNLPQVQADLNARITEQQQAQTKVTAPGKGLAVREALQ